LFDSEDLPFGGAPAILRLLVIEVFKKVVKAPRVKLVVLSSSLANIFFEVDFLFFIASHDQDLSVDLTVGLETRRKVVKDAILEGV